MAEAAEDPAFTMRRPFCARGLKEILRAASRHTAGGSVKQELHTNTWG